MKKYVSVCFVFYGLTSDVDDEGEIIPTLEALPDHTSHGHKAVFINEPKLADFKRVLQLEGYQAEFAGGVLIVNDFVAVRRVGVICLIVIYYVAVIR